MTNLIKGSLNDDAANQYLQLATELGIDLDGSNLLAASDDSYTGYPIPKGCRTLIDAFKKDSIEWNQVGQTTEFKEKVYMSLAGELVEFGPINEIGGIVLGYWQRDQLGYYDGQNMNVTCSVVGYTHPVEGPIRDLPNVPYKNKYRWGDDKKIDRMSPDPIVSKLELVGSRGLRCDECIKCGLSYQDVEVTEGGTTKTKTVECEPRGKLLIAVSEVTKINLKKNPIKGGDPIEEKNSKSIYDLVDEDGKPFEAPLLVCVNMSKSFIRGGKKGSGLVGYTDYVKNLSNYGSVQSSPVYNFTTLRMKMVEGGKVYQPHFESHGIPPVEVIRAAFSVYQKPVRTVAALKPGAVPVVGSLGGVAQEEDNGGLPF